MLFGEVCVIFLSPCPPYTWSLSSLLKLTAALFVMQVELSSLLDAVQQTETKMVEMSALNHLMSTHVLQQAQQIELLYERVRNLSSMVIFAAICYLASISAMLLTSYNLIFLSL